MIARGHFIAALMGTLVLLAAGCVGSPPDKMTLAKGGTLNLEVQQGAPVISGVWQAGLSRELVNGQVWFLTTVTVDQKSTAFPVTLPVRDFSLIFDVGAWASQTSFSNDAGQMLFRGKRQKGRAEGTFVFAPNPVYLRACGVLRTKPSCAELFELALYDVRVEELIGYAGSGLEMSATELCGLKALGVKASYVKALRQAGDFSLDDIKRLNSFGVPEGYVSQVWNARCVSNTAELVQLYRYGLSAQEVMGWKWSGSGFDPYAISRLHARGITSRFGALVTSITGKTSEEELIRLQDFGLSEAHLAAMQRVKLKCSLEDLTLLYSRGVDAEYFAAWRDAGYDFDIAKIVQLRRGNVSSRLAEPLKDCGFEVADFLKLQLRGVPADYVLAWRKADFALEVEDFVRLYIAGVPASYAAELKGVAVSTDDLLRLFQKGFSPQDIREINGAVDLEVFSEAGK